MNLSAIITQLVAIAKADAAKDILPLLAQFFTSIAANPSAVNVTLQLTQLNVSILATLPTIATDELKALAAIVNAAAQAAVTPAAPAHA